MAHRPPNNRPEASNPRLIDAQCLQSFRSGGGAAVLRGGRGAYSQATAVCGARRRTRTRSQVQLSGRVCCWWCLRVVCGAWGCALAQVLGADHQPPMVPWDAATRIQRSFRARAHQASQASSASSAPPPLRTRATPPPLPRGGGRHQPVTVGGRCAPPYYIMNIVARAVMSVSRPPERTPLARWQCSHGCVRRRRR